MNWLERVWTQLGASLTGLVQTPLDPGARFYFVYLLTFVGFAWVGWRLHYAPQKGNRQQASFLGFLFPRSIYLHPSAITDYCIYVINVVLGPLTGVFSIALNTAVSTWVAVTLLGWNDGQPVVRGEWNNSINVAFFLGFTLASDLSVYIIHRLHHRLDLLWPIHALHHSAEVMTPVTLFRKHPLWSFTATLSAALLTGLFQGTFLFVFFGAPDYTVLLGVNTFYALFNFFASNLRHSHVWLSWGKPLSYLFISPAMHQIHHDPKRMNKNYGEIFAVWDWALGSLYIPEERETFAIGLGDEGNPHNTVARAYWVPVVDVGRVMLRKFGLARPAKSG